MSHSQYICINGISHSQYICINGMSHSQYIHMNGTSHIEYICLNGKSHSQYICINGTSHIESTCIHEMSHSWYICSVWKSSPVQSFAEFGGNWTATSLFISRKPKRLDRTAKDRLQPVLRATGCPMNVELDHPIILIYYTSQTDENWVRYEHYKIMPPNQLKYACKCQ